MESEYAGNPVYIPYTGPQVASYRPPSGGPAYPDWKDEASCNGKDPSLWELDEVLTRLNKTQRGEQEVRIAEGLKVCASCPVRQECKRNSNEYDRYWTTRGGQPPEGLFQDSKRPLEGPRKATVVPDKRAMQVRCAKNHDAWITRKDGKRYCGECKRLANKARFL